MAELTMTVVDCGNPSRGRWELAGPDGLVIADQDVRLDEASWQYEAFNGLYGYLHIHAVPDRRLRRESEIISDVAAWAGREVLGRIGDALIEAARPGPVTVRVIVPEEPPTARQVAYLPLRAG